MRISDWSSDVCSSGLIGRGLARAMRTAISGRPGGVYLDIPAAVLGEVLDAEKAAATVWPLVAPAPRPIPEPAAVDRPIDLLASAERDRKSGVLGKSGSVRVERGGRRIIKKKKT